MRLSRLDLVRYGRFTDARIEFPTIPSGRPDLHVVYGPNEAGKSTLFSAILDILFGIEAKTRYGFLHPPGTMRLGARLALTDGPQEVLRLWRPQILLDAKERPLPEGVFRAGLAGLDRTSYRSMFSLDDETLEEGGEAIIASDGDLGQLLFSATAGLAGLSRTLGLVRSEAEGFYKPRGHSHGLAEAKKRLAALKTRKDEIDTLASAYNRLVATRDGTAALYDAAIVERARLQGALDEAGRHLRALPLLEELSVVRGELGRLPDIPGFPSEWSEGLPRLQVSEVELETRLTATRDDIARIEAVTVAEDPAALESAPRFRQLADARARYATAAQDLPERRLQLAEADATVAHVMRLLGCGDGAPDGLWIAPQLAGRLRALIERRSGVDASREAARTELAAAERRCAASAAGAGSPEVDQTLLPQVVADIAASDHEARRRNAERSLCALRPALEERIADLEPWAGDAEALARLRTPPSAEVARLRSRLDASSDAMRGLRAEHDRLLVETQRLVDEISATSEAYGPIDDAKAAEVRIARDAAWDRHVATLDAASAAVFASAMKADDAIGAGRLGHGGVLAAQRERRRTLAIRQTELARTLQLMQAAARDQAVLEGEGAAMRAACSPSLEGLAPGPFAEWIEGRKRALEVHAAVRSAEGDRVGALDDGRRLEVALRSALSVSGDPVDQGGSLADLLAASRTVLRRRADAQVLRERAAEALRDLEARRERLAAAETAASQWDEAWRDACGATWMSRSASVPDVDAVRETLGHLADLGPAVQRRDGLTHRIARMEDDQLAFAGDVRAIASILAMPCGDVSPLVVADAIEERIVEAAAARTAATSRAKDLGDAMARLRAAERALDVLLRRKGEMTAHFQVDSLDSVARAMQGSQRRVVLAGRAATIEARMVEAAGGGEVAMACDLIGRRDRATLELTIGELEVRLEGQEQRVRELFHARSKASDALDAVGGDDAPARLEEERRTVLLEIEDGAMRHLALRAGILAAEEALRLYRETHRSSMMQRASSAFATISGGAYEGLAVQAAKDAERLVGISRGGGSKMAREMSKGTRFQLYLALRVAGYHEFVRARGPVPFVADDIMETFDDERASHAFRLLADMAASGQVIYLTHHRHLCEIARAACPDVVVHELNGRKAPEARPEISVRVA